MASDDKDTLADRWIRWLKNQPILAALVVCGMVIGAIASFTDSLSKLGKSVFGEQTPIQTSDLRPDYSQHPLLWDPSLLHPELRRKVEQLRAAAAKRGINLQYYEVYRPPAVQQRMFQAEVTHADAWRSLKQYGLEATLLPYGTTGWIEEPPPGTVQQLAVLATTVGLMQAGTFGQYARLTFALPNVKLEELRAGSYPANGDEAWASNLNNQIDAWGTRTPPAPSKVTER
jgi:hypothetical protein